MNLAIRQAVTLRAAFAVRGRAEGRTLGGCGGYGAGNGHNGDRPTSLMDTFGDWMEVQGSAGVFEIGNTRVRIEARTTEARPAAPSRFRSGQLPETGPSRPPAP